jgi:hypothetical protein
LIPPIVGGPSSVSSEPEHAVTANSPINPIIATRATPRLYGTGRARRPKDDGHFRPAVPLRARDGHYGETRTGPATEPGR